MRIIDLEVDPIENYPYWIVQSGEFDINGNQILKEINLPILIGKVSGLEKDIDAIIATSDLQGMIKNEGGEHLLGEKLPEFLSVLIEMELPELDKKRMGVVLCGDLYTTLKKRGERGDVKEVWRKFNNNFKWVAGVAGNHDDFGSDVEFEKFKQEDSIFFLDRQIKEIDKIKIGGISGIIGRSDKPQRIEEKEYLSILKKLLNKEPTMILLHQGPSVVEANLEGSVEIRNMIECSPSNLIFCGHSHWESPLVVLKNGSQIINLDGRVLILINKK
jgi:3',5'-cyclic-AMP phosphodiesterase